MESHLQNKQLIAIFCFCLCFVAIANAMPAPQDPSQEEVLAKRLVDFQRWLYRMLDREARANYPMNLAALRELEGNIRLGLTNVKRGSDVPNRASRGGMGLCLWKVCPTAPWMRST